MDVLMVTLLFSGTIPHLPAVVSSCTNEVAIVVGKSDIGDMSRVAYICFMISLIKWKLIYQKL